MERYYRAKRRLFEKTSVAVVNADDPYCQRLLCEDLPVKRWVACRTSNAHVHANPWKPHGYAYVEQIRLMGQNGSEFYLSSPTARFHLQCPLPGDYNVINTAQAALAALELGVPVRIVKEALRSFKGVRGRLERVPLPTGACCTVYIDFAHTPDALTHLLHAVRGFRRPEQRIVLLFGCGGDRDRSKRREMAHIASRMADMTVLTSDNCRSEPPEQIMADMLKGMDKERPYTVIYDRAEAIRYTIENAQPGDVILLCGKGHEAYEIDKEGVRPFSERDVVQAAAAERWSLD